MVKKIILAVLLVALLIAVFALARLVDRDVDVAGEQTNEETQTQQTEEVLLPGLEDSFSDDEWDEEIEPTEEEATEAAEDEETTDPAEEMDTTDPTTGKDAATTKPGTTEETTKPTQPGSGSGETTTPNKPESSKISYEEYESMSAAQQKDYMNSFGSVENFFDWYNNAKEEYDAKNPDIEIEDGKVEIGKTP